MPATWAKLPELQFKNSVTGHAGFAVTVAVIVSIVECTQDLQSLFENSSTMCFEMKSSFGVGWTGYCLVLKACTGSEFIVDSW